MPYTIISITNKKPSTANIRSILFCILPKFINKGYPWCRKLRVTWTKRTQDRFYSCIGVINTLAKNPTLAHLIDFTLTFYLTIWWTNAVIEQSSIIPVRPINTLRFATAFLAIVVNGKLAKNYNIFLSIYIFYNLWVTQSYVYLI